MALWIGIALAGLAVAGAAATAVFVAVVESGLPPVPTFDEYARAVPKVSRVLAADGTVVAEFFTERRTVLRPDAIPPVLESALLAAEDARFYEHEGLSYSGILRAMLMNLWRGRVSQGGSTLTQQVVKQVLLTPERTLERKFRELLLSRSLERKLTKKEILAVYLTEVYLGHGRYGFEEAARFYFGKTAAELVLPEAALLAGLVSAPEANSPVRNPQGAIARQHYVLGRMVEEGKITQAQADAASREKIPLWARGERRLGTAPYFVDAVRRETTRIFGEGRLLHDGLTIETTLDIGVSDAAEMAVGAVLGRQWAAGRTRDQDERDAERIDGVDDGADDLMDALPPPPRTVRARVTRCDPAQGRIEVEAAGQPALLNVASLARQVLGGQPDIYAICRGGVALPVSQAPDPVTIDGRRIQTVNAELGPQASMVVVDPATRGVRAMVGGEDFVTRPYNRAMLSRRPIGSTVKPFLYAAAQTEGVSPHETFENTVVSFRGARGRAWTPRNYEGGYDGRAYTMAEALAKSVNVVAVKVMQRIGPGPVADLLAQLGIPNAPRDLSLALGSAEASPLALANAFATFATGGLHDTPYFIRRVRDSDGNTLLRHDERPSRLVPAGVAASIRAMMRQVVVTGTAKTLADLPVAAWGKTGTSNRSREAWFAGWDGRDVAVVQLAYDDRLPMHKATGGNAAVPFFRAYVELLGRAR